MLIATEHYSIVRNDEILSGEPIIRGTRTPVRAIVETYRMSVTPEDIQIAIPHLTMVQIFNALSYYHDHQNEINRYIDLNRIPDEQIDPLVRAL